MTRIIICFKSEFLLRFLFILVWNVQEKIMSGMKKIDQKKKNKRKNFQQNFLFSFFIKGNPVKNVNYWDFFFIFLK